MSSQTPEAFDSEKAKYNLILLSHKTWDKISSDDKSVKQFIQSSIERGISVVMLDAGDKELGQGYPSRDGDLGPLQGVTRVTDPRINHYDLFGGIVLSFKESAEPETHLFSDINNRQLWNNMPHDYSGMWNGLRGGLTIPASDMEISGLNSTAYLEQWKVRGAEMDTM